MNVGCVPKKMMHGAAALGDALREQASPLGWHGPAAAAAPGPGREHPHDWPALRDAVQRHIKRLNFLYGAGLRTAGVDYVNAPAALRCSTGPREAPTGVQVAYDAGGDPGFDPSARVENVDGLHVLHTVSLNTT